MEQNNENGTPSSSEQMPAASGYSDGAFEAVTIFVPRESSLGGNQSDAVLAEIAKNTKLIEDFVASTSRIEEVIREIKDTQAQNAAELQAKINEVAELNEVVEREKKLDEEKWARIKALETQVQALWDIVRPSGRQEDVGETPPPQEGSARPGLAGDGDGAPPPSVPPVEIKTGPESHKELQLEVPDDTFGIADMNLEEARDQDLDFQEKPVKPGAVPLMKDSPSPSAPAKKDGGSGTRSGMDKKALLTFMEGLLDSQDRDRDQKESELENVGFPAPAPIDKNLIAQDMALEDSDSDDDDEDDEDDLGSDASPKKMKLSAEARKNPSEKKERANSEETKGKGVSVPIPSPAVAVVSGARPSLLTGRSPSKPASPEGLSPASVGTSGRGAFSSRRPFSFGNNDNDNKPKLHKTCEHCGKPYTNVDSDRRVMLYHAYTNMDEFLKHQKKKACKPF